MFPRAEDIPGVGKALTACPRSGPSCSSPARGCRGFDVEIVVQMQAATAAKLRSEELDRDGRRSGGKNGSFGWCHNRHPWCRRRKEADVGKRGDESARAPGFVEERPAQARR